MTTRQRTRFVVWSILICNWIIGSSLLCDSNMQERTRYRQHYSKVLSFICRQIVWFVCMLFHFLVFSIFHMDLKIKIFITPVAMSKQKIKITIQIIVFVVFSMCFSTRAKVTNGIFRPIRIFSKLRFLVFF